MPATPTLKPKKKRGIVDKLLGRGKDDEGQS
jgi:hypothetical protein